MYRDMRNNRAVEVRFRDGKLTLDGQIELTPTGPSQFSGEDSHFAFNGTGFRQLEADGDVVFERVEPVHTKVSDLAALVGTYESAEVDSALKVAVKGDRLTLAIAPSIPVELRPTFRDAFMMPGGSASIRFLRDSNGNVTPLANADSRT